MEGKVFAAVSEEKPSSNPLASVMDRLAAIKLKVTEGGSSNNASSRRRPATPGTAPKPPPSRRRLNPLGPL